MNGRHIRLNNHLNMRKQKAYIMNGHHSKLKTSSKYKKTKSIYYGKPPHEIENII